MKKEWNDVKEFHEKFGHPVATTPVAIDKKRALSRGKWMNEEVAEFLVADDIYEQADAMIDVMYFALGTMVEMGLEPDKLFAIVQEANMSKLWADGKPHYNPKDGKIMKPEGWEDPKPKIKEYIDHMRNRAATYQEAKEMLLSDTTERVLCYDEDMDDYADSLMCQIYVLGMPVGVSLFIKLLPDSMAQIHDVGVLLDPDAGDWDVADNFYDLYAEFDCITKSYVEDDLEEWLKKTLIGTQIKVNTSSIAADKMGK